MPELNVQDNVAAVSDATAVVDKVAVEQHIQEAASKAEGLVKIGDLLDLSISKGVSDIHFGAAAKISLRLHGVIVFVDTIADLSDVMAEGMIRDMLSESDWDVLVKDKELDFGYLHDDGTMVRGNAFYRRGGMACVLRIIPKVIKRIDELGLPEVTKDFIKTKQGLVLVTGPTGSGKSTTMASMIEEINCTDVKHIVSVEDPIEFVFSPKKSIFSQREVGEDTINYKNALKSALREDPDVIIISEMRDPETIMAALTLAETGHLVFSTLHTSSAATTITRIASSFPSTQQDQILSRLSESLLGTVSQRLLPNIKEGGLIPAFETLINNDAISNLIRKGELTQIDNAIQVGFNDGMISMERSLSDLVASGLISVEDAKALLPQSALIDSE
jgi:twitching motility protein PilT